MSNDAKKAVDAITSKKLSDLGVEPKTMILEPDEELVTDTHSITRKTLVTRKKKSAPKPVTSYEDYAKQFPAIQTPHVLSKEKVDATLLKCRELPWPDGDFASYEPKDKDVLIATLYRYFNDVVEGAGLYIKGGDERDKLRERLWKIVTDHYFHKDPYDNQYRVIREKK